MTDALNSRGIARCEKREYEKALADYDEVIHLNPAYFHAFINRGCLRCIRKDYEKAVHDFDEAVRLSPGNDLPRFNRAVALMLADRREAFEAFRSLISTDGWKT